MSVRLFQPGEIINEEYTVVEQIARGGFGTVLKVRDSAGILRALKFTTHIGEDLERFEREIKLLERLQLEGIATVIDYELRHSPPYYVMPFAEATLEEKGPEYRQRGEKALLDVFKSVCIPVGRIHGEGVIHRDIKPSNVLIVEDQIVVADFGIARNVLSTSTTLTQSALGSYEYCAPEQFTTDGTKNADERTDVYQLGKLLYWLYTGESPAHPDLSKLPGGIKRIVELATKRDKGDRFRDIASLLQAIEVYEATVSSTADSYAPVVVGLRTLTLEQTAVQAEEAIREERRNKTHKIRAFWDRLAGEIVSRAPDLSQAVDDELFVTAIEITKDMAVLFGRVANALAEAGDLRTADALLRGFEQLASHYHFAPGVGGFTNGCEWDYFKFLGHELFVMMISPLIQDEQWDIVRGILDNELYIPNPNHNSNSNHVPFNYLEQGLQTLVIRENRLHRYRDTERNTILRERHAAEQLVTLAPIEHFAEADYFLYLRSLAVATSEDQYWLCWTPWTMHSLRHAPHFLLRARSRRYALELLNGLRVPNIERLREIVSVAGSRRVLGGHPLALGPLRNFNPESLGSVHP